MKKILFLIFFTLFISGCSNDSEKITMYLVREDVQTGKTQTIITPFPAKTFLVWKNAGVIVLTEKIFMTSIKNINKNCIVENKENWICYREKTEKGIYEWNTKSFVLSGGESKPVDYGVINGKWVTEDIYWSENNADQSFIYSVPYWKWIFYKALK